MTRSAASKLRCPDRRPASVGRASDPVDQYQKN